MLLLAFGLKGDLFSLLIAPFLIIIARVIDVTLQTLRIILISRGKKKSAPIIGFIEVFIWIIVIGQILNHLDNFIYYLAYATGFALGNYLGIIIDNKMALGYSNIQILIFKDENELFKAINSEGYKIIQHKAGGTFGEISIYEVIIQRKMERKIRNLVEKYSPDSYIAINEVQRISQGFLPKMIKAK